MDLLLKNLAIVKKRWPAVFDIVSGADEPKNVYLDTSARQTSLVIDGIHLSSAYSRRKEAELQASLVPMDRDEAWVYGLGVGDLPQVLLSRNQIKKLHVVILNPAVAKQCFVFFDHFGWLQDPRVNLTVVSKGNDDLRMPFAAAAPCLQLADEHSSRLRDLILLELSTPFIRKRHATTNKDLIQRIEENTEFARIDGDVATLFGSRMDSSIVIAAAGPTLSDHYSWLQLEKSRFTLVAVDAALKPLTNAGIHPDIVVTIDRSLKGVKPFFQGISLEVFKNTPLVYFPEVHAEVLNSWPGPRLTAYPESELYHSIARKYPKGTLFSSGSVVHPAVDLAVRMGTNRIFLLGFDFSFPGGLSHVKGSPATQAASAAAHWVLNGEGKQVTTLPNLRGYLRDLEQYIALRTDIQFINGSKKGARIMGASYIEGGL